MIPQPRLHLPTHGPVSGCARGVFRFVLIAIALSLGLSLVCETSLAQTGATNSSSLFRAYSLKHTSIENVQPQLAELLRRMSSGAELVSDPRHNRFLLQGDEQAHKLAQQLIAALDRPAANQSVSPRVGAGEPFQQKPKLVKREPPKVW